MTLRDEILAANAEFAATFALADVPGQPVRRFAVVTCMDARLDPVAFLGLRPGDAHVIRNAGGVVSDDALRSLAGSHWLMATQEAIVIAHMNCGMQRLTNDELRQRIEQEAGVDARDLDFLPFADLEESVRGSVRRIRESTLLPDSYVASGFVYDTQTGLLAPIE